MMIVDETLKKAPMAKIKVDTPYFVGEVDALCQRESLFDLDHWKYTRSQEPP